MKIATMIFAGLCRIATEYGMPILAFFVFSLPVAITILVAFILWQIISVIYLGPMYKKQVDEKKQDDIDFAVRNAVLAFRIELMGRMSDDERIEVTKLVKAQLEKDGTLKAS